MLPVPKLCLTQLQLMFGRSRGATARMIAPTLTSLVLCSLQPTILDTAQPAQVRAVITMDPLGWSAISQSVRIFTIQKKEDFLLLDNVNSKTIDLKFDSQLNSSNGQAERTVSNSNQLLETSSHTKNQSQVLWYSIITEYLIMHNMISSILVRWRTDILPSIQIIWLWL